MGLFLLRSCASGRASLGHRKHWSSFLREKLHAAVVIQAKRCRSAVVCGVKGGVIQANAKWQCCQVIQT